MRFLAYNIRDGGQDPGSDRLDLIVSVIRDASPDAVLVSEAAGLVTTGRPGLASARLYRLEQATGMRAIVLETSSASFVAVLLKRGLSPSRADAVRGDFHHGALAVELPLPAGRPLTVIAAHLHPFSSVARAAEAQCLAWYAGHAERNAHVLLAGDLNSVSGPDVTANLMPPRPANGWPVRFLDPVGTLDTAPVAILERVGLDDCFRRLNPGDAGPTDPTPAFASPGDPPLRVDFCFAGPSLAALARTCLVLRLSPADRASDHYPLLAEFEI